MSSYAIPRVSCERIGLTMNHEEIRKRVVSGVKRIVLKLGSSVVTTERGLDRVGIRSIVDDVWRYKASGREFIVVSSGAVAAGVRRLGLKGGAKTIPQKQAAAAVGQTRLMAAYEEAFASHNVKAGQMLLTKDDLSHRRRFLNASNTLTTLLSYGVVPIINENDTVMVEEIRLGDNDNLSAMVASLADADLLIMLTDMEGFMDCDPRTNPDACLIPVVEEITPDLRKLATDSSSGVGRGGMASKLDAASKAAAAGIPTLIAGGKSPDIIPRLLEAEVCGTLIMPAKAKISARKHWMRYHLEPEGYLVIDAGAVRALTEHGKSLLPVGIKAVGNEFEHGAAVSIRDTKGVTLAVGLVSYSSDELRKIMGHHTSEIDWILGYRRNDEAVHADNLVPTDTDGSR